MKARSSGKRGKRSALATTGARRTPAAPRKATKKKTTKKKTTTRTGAALPRAGASTFRLHFLDMGRTMYGDSIVCEIGGRRILIDGGHLADASPADGHPSIPAQLGQILGGAGPFDFDLLIVTHCHADHIGCLPKLVQQGTVKFGMALVADPDLGWGITGRDAPPLPRDDQAQRALAAIREEDISAMPAAQVDAFLADAAELSDSYRAMLDTLTQRGTNVIRYTDPADAAPVERAFAPINLHIYGPTNRHLGLCASEIARIGRDSLDRLSGLRAGADGPVDAVRLLLSDIAIDRVGIGAALNDQSIVLSMEANGRRALLLGDMQFAQPEVPGLDAEMGTLFQAVSRGVPFDLIKTPHHTSYNGIDTKVLGAFPTTDVWVHSGGSQDAGHPDPSALKALKDLNKGNRKISFARTDRNGLISVDLSAADVAIRPTRGGFDDYTPNQVDAGPAAAALAPRPGPAAAPISTVPGQQRPQTNAIEVHALVPLGTRARITIDVDSQPGSGNGQKGRADFPSTFRLADDRPLNPLLFITDLPKLSNSIGPFAQECADAVRAAGHRFLDLRGESDPDRTLAAARAANADPALVGIVILGGPSILPPRVVDALPDSVRRQVTTSTDDPDDFYIWSDEPYADRDGDLIAELPISRIPDCGSADFVRTALSAPRAGTPPASAGYRNINRPFAEGIFASLPGASSMVLSELATPESIGDGAVIGDALYIMLHGSDSDGSRFWGETRDGRGLLALRPENVGPLPGAVVFTGCCWGAMAWSPMARRAVDGTPITARTPSTSLALQFLAQGVLAFIGCTGAHYSPDRPPYNSAGGPMHRAFWKHSALGKPPAKALFDAKADYAGWMKQGSTTPESLAVSFKILRQYTCLGLGW